MFALPDNIELIVVIVLAVLSFVVTRWIANVWRKRRGQREDETRRANESRQVRRARERRQK